MNITSNKQLDRKDVRGQIISIFFIQITSTISFAVFYSGLSIYLTQNQFFSKESASLVTGLFLSINYFLPLIGGIIANHFISFKKLYVIGTISNFIGCLLLINNNLYLGLSLFLMSSVSNVCLNIFLTQLFTINQKIQRRVAFIWNYVGMNLGFMLGYFLTGFSTITNSYFYLFILMSFLVVLSLILTIIFIKEPKVSSRISKSAWHQIMIGAFIIILLVAVIDMLFHYANVMHNFITGFTIIMFCLIMYYALTKSRHDQKQNLIKFIYFSLLTIIFWTFYMLTPIAIMQLIENSVQRNLFNIYFAPQWFTNINSVVILVFAPILTMLIKSKKIFNDSENYFTIGFLFVFFGFVLMTLGLYSSIGLAKLSSLSVLGYLVCLTFGELFISAIGDSFIGELIQESLRGLMTGVARVNICIGVLLASTIGNEFVLPYINKGGLSVESSIKLVQFFFIASCLFLLLACLVPLILRNKRVSKQKYNDMIKKDEILGELL
ncbi:MAG: MFS transporter [Gammaproteobacteria bacterium]|nr:MFS transporter [Gammaproteobacteria bacterium]